VELNVAAAVDPFAKAYAVFNASADPITGESSLGSKRPPADNIAAVEPGA